MPARDRERHGCKRVSFPGRAFMIVCRAVAERMGELKQKGTTSHLMDRMATLEECFETVGLSEMLALDSRYAKAEPVAGGNN